MTIEKPNWFDYQDRQLYDNLLKMPTEKLSDKEHKFIVSMYHAEEYACGLDGLCNDEEG